MQVGGKRIGRSRPIQVVVHLPHRVPGPGDSRPLIGPAVAPAAAPIPAPIPACPADAPPRPPMVAPAPAASPMVFKSPALLPSLLILPSLLSSVSAARPSRLPTRPPKSRVTPFRRVSESNHIYHSPRP